MKADVYERVTGQIVAALEKGVRPWFAPWNAEHAARSITRPLRFNGIPYRGINVIMLWSEALAAEYKASMWLTFRQARKLNAYVRKGETGSFVVYASAVTRRDKHADTGEETPRDIPYLKTYSVFNVEQVEGLPAKFYANAEPRLDPVRRIGRAEVFFATTGASVQHGGNQAFYSFTQDQVRMPPFESFRDADSYYSTLAHEVTHWTAHPSRLERDFGRKRWGDQGYAMEELVAELGSAFLSADLDLTPEPRADHAAYLASWLSVLKDDKRAIFTAAAHAQRAADYLHTPQGLKQDET
jgi:antirestriction protein ArdC